MHNITRLRIYITTQNADASVITIWKKVTNNIKCVDTNDVSFEMPRSFIFRSCIFRPCELVRHFPVFAFSRPTIWSVIFRSCIFRFCYLVHHFQVLHFQALWIGPSFSGLAFSGPAFSVAPSYQTHSLWPDCLTGWEAWLNWSPCIRQWRTDGTRIFLSSTAYSRTTASCKFSWQFNTVSYFHCRLVVSEPLTLCIIQLPRVQTSTVQRFRWPHAKLSTLRDKILSLSSFKWHLC